MKKIQYENLKSDTNNEKTKVIGKIITGIFTPASITFDISQLLVEFSAIFAKDKKEPSFKESISMQKTYGTMNQP